MSRFGEWAGNSFRDRVNIRHGAALVIQANDGQSAAEEWFKSQPEILPNPGESTAVGFGPFFLCRRLNTRYVIDTPMEFLDQ
jgi:hypothetical protein